MRFLKILPIILPSLFLFLACDKKENASVVTAAPDATSKIVIGVQPNEGQFDLAPLKKELTQRLGEPTEIVTSKDYGELVEKFKKGTVDFAFFTGLTFIQAEREAGAKVLLKKIYGKEEFYYSAIVVKDGSPFKKLSDLKGKTFGFVDPKSASGYLYPRMMLRQAGMDAGDNPRANLILLKHKFLGTHDDAVKALMRGEVDAVGVWANDPVVAHGAWTQTSDPEVLKTKFRVLKFSDPIPNDAFAVRSQVYQEHPETVLKVMDTLITMASEPNGPLKKILDVEGMATATSRHYDSVRELEKLLLSETK